MTDLEERLSRIQRPKELIRSARFGIDFYDRERDLARVCPDRPGRESLRALFERLLKAEAEAERTRLAGEAGYSPAHHIEILIALMAEAHFSLPALG